MGSRDLVENHGGREFDNDNVDNGEGEGRGGSLFVKSSFMRCVTVVKSLG